MRKTIKKILDIICDKKSNSNKDIFKLCVYLCLGIFFIFKVNFYEDRVGRFPDEIAHVSYVAYLEANNEVVPNFKNMTILDGVDLESNKIQTGKFSKDKINYLGHPPLYYNIIKIFGGVQCNGNKIKVDISRMRMISKIIAYLGLFIAFYIGFTRISRGINNLLYASIIVLTPMLSYTAGGISNDTLCFLGMNILFWGFIRIFENKRDKKTYFFIAIGYFILLLTKLTAGLIAILAGIMIIIYICFKEKSLKILICKEFAITLPFYVICLVYHIYTIATYGSINPSLSVIAPEYYKNSMFYVPKDQREIMSFAEYARYYWNRFFQSWTGISSHVCLLKQGNIFNNQSIVVGSILVLPIFSVIPFGKNKIKKSAMFIYISIVLSIIYQFFTLYRGYKNVNGYLGGCQSRYYLCGIAIMSLLICIFIEDVYKIIKDKLTTNKSVYILKILFCLLVIYLSVTLLNEDILFFVKHFQNYIS